jgi:hypothetical protein
MCLSKCSLTLRVGATINMDSPGFRYDTTQRAAISSHAPREFSRDDWLYLETVAANYQLAFFQTLLTKRSATRIEKTARKLENELKRVLPVKDPCLLPPEIRLRVWLQDIYEIRSWARAQQRPKSKLKRSNRARSDALQEYLFQLVLFFLRCGGSARRAPSSSCVCFVGAAANPAVVSMNSKKLKANAISNLIRTRFWLARDLASPRPELGAPPLTIND